MKYELKCGCGRQKWIISDGSSGTKICPSCHRKIQFTARAGKIS